MAERALATAYVNIVPGTKAIEGYLKNGLGNQVGAAGARAGTSFGGAFKSKFGSIARGIAAPLAVAFGAQAVTTYFAQAVQGASNLAEQGAAVSQVFGSGAGAIDKFASGAATRLGQTKTQVLEASKSFGIFGKSAGLTEKGNADFSTSLVTLATDLASFNNTSVDEALNALSSGLRGEAEPLRRYGVLLNEAALKDEALRLGLITTTKQALTPQQKILAANSAIFKQTEIQQGDFARTSDGLANQQRILTASFDDAQATLGTSLLPAMTTIVGYINTSIMPAVQAFFTAFKEGKTPLNDAINGLKGVYEWIVGNATWLGPLVAAIGGGILAFKIWTGAIALYNTIMRIATGVQLAFNIVMSMNPIMLIVIAVAALVAGLIYFFTQTKLGQEIWANFTAFLGSAWDSVVGAFTAAFEFIGSAFKGYVNFYIGLFEGFINFAIGGVNGIVDGLNTALDGVAFATGGVIDLNVGKIPSVKLPRLAKGGFVDSPTTALIGEAGPEVVTPLKDFERMMGLTAGGSDRPIYADGIGLIGMIRETAQGQAKLVFNDQLGKVMRGAR
jgi:hypothetical protein